MDSNNSENSIVWQFRLIFILIVLVVVAAVLLPILIKVPDYPFLWDNVFFIVTFFIFFNWVFFLRFSWFGKMKWIKLIVLFSVLPFLTLLLDRFTKFQAFLDEVGIQSILTNLHYNESHFLVSYIPAEVIFFAAASMVSVIIVGFRMIHSIWRYRNRGIV